MGVYLFIEWRPYIFQVLANFNADGEAYLINYFNILCMHIETIFSIVLHLTEDQTYIFIRCVVCDCS